MVISGKFDESNTGEMVTGSSNQEEKEPWQMKINSLAEGVKYIFDNENFWDVKFIVSGQEFKGHRLILGSRSQKFKAMLLKPDPPCEIRDDSSRIGFEILWRYIYTNELKTTDESEMLEAFRVATKFEMQPLIDKCKEFIQNIKISCDNVCTLLNQVSDIELLKDRCLQFISLNPEGVLESPDFLKATPNTLVDIFNGQYLKNVPTAVLQRNVLLWGKNQFSELEDFTLVREHLMNIRIMQKLRIQELNHEELLDFVINYPELLTDKEFRQFNVHAKKPNQPLPAWCQKE